MQIPIFRGGGCMKKVKLGEICEVQAGGTPSRNKKEFWVQGNIPWVKIKDINSKYISKVEEHITELGLQFSSAKLFSRGTILYTIFATIGEVAILDIDAATNQAIAGLHLKSEKVLKEYLYFFLLSIKNRVKNDSRGVAQNNINLTYLKNIEVPIVENSIQQEICNNLTKINQIITLRNQQLIELSNLVKSRFNEMFGDFYTTLFPKYKIGEKFELSSGSTPSRDNKLYWDSGTINWVKTTEVINKEITETEEKITKFALESTSLKLFPVNTILIAMYGQGQTRGRSAILKVESTSNQACGAIFPNKIDNPVFIWHQLMLRYSELRELGRGGNQPNLNGQLIKNFELILPPLSLQNEFADFVAQVDKSQLAIQKSLDELETLKKSLMQEYFG